jgi:hypothetical protein
MAVDDSSWRERNQHGGSGAQPETVGDARQECAAHASRCRAREMGATASSTPVKPFAATGAAAKYSADAGKDATRSAKQPRRRPRHYELTPQLRTMVDRWKLTPAEVDQLWAKFCEIDGDQSGTIEMDEFFSFINEPRSTFLDTMFALIVRDNNRHLDFAAWIEAVFGECSGGALRRLVGPLPAGGNPRRPRQWRRGRASRGQSKRFPLEAKTNASRTAPCSRVDLILETCRSRARVRGVCVCVCVCVGWKRARSRPPSAAAAQTRSLFAFDAPRNDRAGILGL